jgi:hypothetical protein
MSRFGIDDKMVGFCSELIDSECMVHVNDLAEFLAIVCDVPDHKYVTSLSGRWCMMWSFEDDLYFGLADQSVAENG